MTKETSNKETNIIGKGQSKLAIQVCGVIAGDFQQVEEANGMEGGDRVKPDGKGRSAPHVIMKVERLRK